VKNKAKVNKESTTHELKAQINTLNNEINSYKDKISCFENLMRDKRIEIPEYEDENEYSNESINNTPIKAKITSAFKKKGATINEAKDEDYLSNPPSMLYGTTEIISNNNTTDNIGKN
jgi:hypothetical protein